MTTFNEIFVHDSVHAKNVGTLDRLLNKAKGEVKKGRTEGTLAEGIKFFVRNLTLILL